MKSAVILVFVLVACTVFGQVRNASVNSSGALVAPTATQFKNANGIAPTNNPVFTGTLNAQDAAVSGTLAANTVNAGALVQSNQFYAATVLKTIDGNVANTWVQTNRATGSQGLSWSNLNSGQFFTVVVRGEAAGGTDRSLTNLVPSGTLVQTNGADLMTSVIIPLPAGYKVEINGFIDLQTPTNVVSLKFDNSKL